MRIRTLCRVRGYCVLRRAFAFLPVLGAVWADRSELKIVRSTSVDRTIDGRVSIENG